MSRVIQLQVRNALQTAQEKGLIRHAYVARFDASCIELIDVVAPDPTWNHDLAWFDLASLTKALCTAPLALHSIDEGSLSLTFEVGERFEGARAHGGRMLLWHLLCHAAGLRAYDHALPPDTNVGLTTSEARAQFVAQHMASWIEDAAGAKTLYSDLGYVTVGVLLEAVYGGSLDRIFSRWLARHLPGLDLAFVGACGPTLNSQTLARPQPVPNGAAPWCSHDPMAAYFRGVAGHAGLWGTGPSVTRWLQALLTRTSDILTPTLASYFIAKPPFFDQGSFTLGLDTASQPSSAGQSYPADVVGHLGFTGCSFWYSPSQRVGSVLLTDRAAQLSASEMYTVPVANRAALFVLRQAVHGACWS